MHRIYTSDRGDTSSTISRTKYRVRACADITRERGHLTTYLTFSKLQKNLVGFSFIWISCTLDLIINPLDFTFLNFIYLGFYVAFNTVQVISRRVVGRAEETSTYSSLGFCTVNCRPMASNYQLSHLRLCRESNPGLRGGRRECYHSATVVPYFS